MPKLLRSSPIALVLTLLLAARPVDAQLRQRLTGYSAAASEVQRAAESDAIARPDAGRAAAHAAELAREPHVAGTPAQARTRDYVIEQLRQLGLETEVREYPIYLPHATGVRVWKLRGDSLELSLEEPPRPEMAATRLAQYPTVNGYSAAGDVTAELVYVNYGLVEDYATLDSLGVSVRGKIAIARYGRSFRGIKAREAERHGARALLMYSDPADDGYGRGDVIPEGPMRPPRGVQRGSVMNGNGDPTTPGWPSRAGGRRLPIDSAIVPRIPVVPIGYANAALLLEGVRGTAIPQPWQGGLPFRYHAGPGPVRARVMVTLDDATAPIKPVWNTFATIRGSDFPDEVIVIGAHRDAWGAGAADNVSGTVSVLETARAIAEQLRGGRRPRRTLVFATWDAEEWGLIGSTEYVEDDSLRLMRGGVAYLNQDVAASGPSFGGGGSPSLRATLRDVARAVPHPGGGGSVYAEWRRASRAAEGAEPAMGDPGGGSDFAGFYNHLGIPHADWGFGGAAGVYHSAYDTHEFMRRWGDTSFAYHAAAARLGAAMMLRLANAEILPYDYAEFARTMRGYLPALHRAMAAKGITRVPTTTLAAAIDRMARTAVTFAAARDAALAGSPLPIERQRRVNGALLGVERALTRAEGLRTRPWFRGLIYAADEDNGYSNVVFPSIAEAVRRGDATLARAELSDLATRFERAAAALQAARAALSAP